MTEPSDSGWLSEELAGCEFKDERLGNRFRTLTERLWRGMGESIPFACQDWANTKAAYRFLSNDRVTEADILAGHFESTRERFEASNGTVLVLQDTTEFSYKREAPELIGSTRTVAGGDRDKKGRPIQHTVCGILMHSSLAVTTEGLPLGLAAVKFWSRKEFKGCNALKRSINPTRVPIEQKESYRWLENLRQSTALFAETVRATYTSYSVLLSNSERIFSSEPAWIGWPAMASIRSLMRWKKPQSKACTGSNSVTPTVNNAERC